jgi:hypothetical protein
LNHDKMRLLILQCSSSKRGSAEPIPAIERYDGPLWRVLRAYRREQGLWGKDLEVFGLSAEYGLIPAEQAILMYERTMDTDRASELRPNVLSEFGALMDRGYDQLCLGVSQRYLHALEGWEELVPPKTSVTVTDGTEAIKLGQLRAWLHDEAWRGPVKRPERLVVEAQPRGNVRIGGVTLSMSREDVLAHARAALREDGKQAKTYRYWYALIDGQPVGVKWLASVLSGLPTSAFQAAQARQALLALGIDVESTSD